ncbi:MAG: hypothetical protein IKK83_04970 [Clostridia bacterium]|nr:hypothetical protein [Clostridia bacterium]
MSYHSDPTAAMALGKINREFEKQVKKAKRLIERYENGDISRDTFENAATQFKGSFRHVLEKVQSGELK